MKGSNSVAIVFCGMCYTREGVLTKADGGGLIKVTIEGKEVDFYVCRVCRLGVYQAFHKMLLASGVPEEETGYLDAVRELESLEDGDDVESLDDTEDIDDVDQNDDDSEHDGDASDDTSGVDDDDVDGVAAAVVSEVAEQRHAGAGAGKKAVRDATVIRNLTTEQKRAIRSWARNAGMQVGDRGPIPKYVIDKYFAEN